MILLLLLIFICLFSEESDFIGFIGFYGPHASVSIFLSFIFYGLGEWVGFIMAFNRNLKKDKLNQMLKISFLFGKLREISNKISYTGFFKILFASNEKNSLK